MAAVEERPAKRSKETKGEKFSRLGRARTKRAVIAIRRLHYLADKNHYDYTPAQAETVISVLNTEVARLQSMFERPKKAAEFDIDI